MEKDILNKAVGHRNTLEKGCPICGIRFLTRVDQPLTCCSKKCGGLARRKRTTKICDQCGKVFERVACKLRDSKSGRRYCSRKCQHASFVQYPSNYKDGRGTKENLRYRDKFNEDEFVCRRCGYCEFSCGVDIHHIDRDRSNNSMENLIPLCTPCHRGLHQGLWKLKDVVP